MATRKPGSRKPGDGTMDTEKLDQVVANARAERDKRMQGYREQSLRIHPWVCARCGREFTHANLHELTVHHKDHNHDNNPPDGSNWENLCLYCHDYEHQKYEEHLRGLGTGNRTEKKNVATHNPFANLKSLLDQDKS